MRSSRSAAIPRLLVLVAGCLVGGTVVARTSWELATDPVRTLGRVVLGPGPRPASLEQVVLGLCALGLLVCVAWLLAVCTLSLTAYAAALVLPESRPATVLTRAAARGCPRWAHRLAVLSLGATLASGAGATGAALADPLVHGGLDPLAGLDGLALPGRTAGPRAADAPSAAGPRHLAAVVVRPGDSLWAIAAARLPATAGDARVTTAWHRLARVNRAVLGEDPDLIVPGTRLVLPVPLTREDQP